MNVILDENNFDTKEVTQNAVIMVEEPTSFDVETSNIVEHTIKIPDGKTIQYDENTWLLYNASLKALTNVTLEQLVENKMTDLNTGIYQYINQVSTLKEQAVTEARALVANLKTDVSQSLATLTKYNNVRATETSSNAQTITSLQANLAIANTNITANATGLTTLTTTVTDLSGENGPIVANASAITALESTVNDANSGVSANASAISTLNTEVGIGGGGLIETVNNLVKQIDGVVETTTGTQDVLDTDDNIVTDAEPYVTWKTADDDNGDDLQRALHTGDTFIKYTEDADGVKTYVDSYRFSRGEVSASNTDADGYGWFKIVDQTAIDALNSALTASDLADGKRRVFSAEPVPPYNLNDLWLTDGGIKKCINERLTGTFVASDFDLATNYTDDSALISFVDDVYSSDMIAVKDQLDHKKEFFFTDDGTTDPKDDWTDTATRNLHNKDVWYRRDEQKAYIYDSITDSWYQDTLANSQQLGIIAAQQTADNKANIYYGSKTISDDWTAEEKVINIGDLLVEETIIDENTVLKNYRWDGTQWVDISDSRITANAEAVTDLGIALVTPGATYNGQTTVLTSLQGDYDAAVGDITTLKSNYSVTTELGTDGNKYITGFGSNSEVIVNADGSTNTVSDFNVRADKFTLTHPTSLNQVLMNQDGLYFKKADGTTAKYLQFIHTYVNHQNEAIISLDNLTRVPQVLMGIHTMPTYSSAHKDQDQSFTFNVEDVVDDITNTGTYSFKPVAKLHLTANTFSEVLTGNFTASTTNVKYTDSYHVETTLNPVTISYNIGSTKGTGVANSYQKRQCSIQMQKSTNNSTWTDVGTAVSVAFGESLTTQTGSVTYTGDIAANNYLRLKFTFSNASGTFTTGATGYWDYQTASAGNTSQFNRNNWTPQIEACSFSTTGAKSDCSGYGDGVTGGMCLKGTCNYGGTPGYSSPYWTDLRQEYRGTECYSPEDVRNTYLPGYTITGASFSISDKTLAGITVHNNFVWTSSSLDTTDANAKKPYAYFRYDSGTSSMYNTLSAYITTTISAKKWIEETGNTTISNTVTDLSLQATAKAGIELATGTMNIIIVE